MRVRVLGMELDGGYDWPIKPSKRGNTWFQLESANDNGTFECFESSVNSSGSLSVDCVQMIARKFGILGAQAQALSSSSNNV